MLTRVGVCVEKSSEFSWQDCPGGEFKEECDQEKEFYLMPGSAAAAVFFNSGLVFVVLARIFLFL